MSEGDKTQTIPIVDLNDIGLKITALDQVEKSAFERIVKELDFAFSTVGFVYLKNHGVDQKLIDDLFRASHSFFYLPKNVKEAYQCGVANCDGYTGPDGELLDNNALHEIRETYDVASPNGLYPDEHAPEVRQAIDPLAPQLSELGYRLMKCMAIGLGLEENFFVSRHRFMYKGDDKNRTIFRTLYYPPLSEEDVQPGIVRCGMHTDYGTITLLIQDNKGGLEILSNGKWIPADPIEGTIMTNLGDMMQFWTDDRYVATMHRVIVPKAELSQRIPRQSIAFFIHPDNEVIIEPINGSAKHKAINALTYVKSRLIASNYK